METNRRNWLKQTSLALVALGTVPLKSFAIPSTATQLIDIQDNNLIRLRSNENPYGPSPLARAAMTNSINSTNRYNWELTSELISNIAKKNNVIAENILMGAGSTEILDLAVRFAALDKGNFVLAEPTYNYWAETAQKLGLKKIAVPLTPDKRHDLPAMLKAIEPETKIIYICNPNNPTGTICDREALITFIKEATKKTLVLLDEAYIDFTNQQSLASLVIENKNLIIAKTFSKTYGLAGARIGYAIANYETITQLSQLQSWPNGAISVVSATGALASIKDEKFTNETNSLNEKARKYTIEQLERLKIPCIPSQTNFIYFSLANYKKDFFEQLKNNNILGTKIYEENGKWSRITIGTMQEMQKFINAIE